MVQNKKTIKEILGDNELKKSKKPLFNPEAINEIKKEFDDWKENTVKENDRNNWNVTPQTILGSEIPREMIYSPLNLSEMDYINDIGYSGKEPFTRGVHPNMYRGKKSVSYTHLTLPTNREV